MRGVLIVIGVVAIIAVVWSFARRPRAAPAGLSPTYEGAIDQYRGGKTLLVAVHAPGASVSRTTAEALAKADPAVYDIALIDTARRFFGPQGLRITEGFPSSSDLCILDVSKRGLDGLRVRVANFEASDGCPTFWAREVVELGEIGDV